MPRERMDIGIRAAFGALVAVALALGVVVAPGSAAAQNEAPEEIDFLIYAVNCETDPGVVSPAQGELPADCAGEVGVTATVELTDGTEVATCTTDADGFCTVQAPNEAEVVVTVDETTVLAGYAPRENPITTQVVTEFAGATFVNLPVADDDGEDDGTGGDTGGTTTLPNTGAGPLEPGGGVLDGAGLMLLVVAAGLVASGGFLLARRRGV